jgi:hypothetical protein
MQLYRLAQRQNLTVEQIRDRLIKESQLLPKQLKRIEWIIFHTVNNFLIGIAPTEHRGTGVALGAGLLVLDFAFNQIFLNKVVAYVYGHNQYAQKNIQALGFIQEGFLRQNIFFEGHRFIDTYVNGMLESDFRNHRRLSRLSKRLLGRDMTLPLPKTVDLSVEQIEQQAEIVKQLIWQNRAKKPKDKFG